MLELLIDALAPQTLKPWWRNMDSSSGSFVGAESPYTGQASSQGLLLLPPRIASVVRSHNVRMQLLCRVLWRQFVAEKRIVIRL